ncbi:cellulose-binding domain-containing protein [Streptomyces sparsogenes]|uniref:Cellulose-binding protein n=1 Tax=Streptomyces sparsogenes DSM 40356 TaxID=1331668 RepID=A0A1R1SKZ8_9ACTN|nr:cellulose-binding domain-containing protein [Streptomyces sparsogenes]OMI38950.1 cellulose-binding protein [Streptomyces sparsogenes DSM 40356]
MLHQSSPDAISETALLSEYWDAVLDYANLCTTTPQDGMRLATEAFRRGIRETRNSRTRAWGPRLPWLPLLLSSVRKTAADWQARQAGDRLDPALRIWLTSDRARRYTTPRRQQPLALRGLWDLPEADAELLWSVEVESRSLTAVARQLGWDPAYADEEIARVRARFRELCQRNHVDTLTDEECRSYAGLLDAATRSPDAAAPDDLWQHLARCAPCKEAAACLYLHGSGLPGALAGGVLGWGGLPYLERRRRVAAENTGGRRLGTLARSVGPPLWDRVKGMRDGGGRPRGGRTAEAAPAARTAEVPRTAEAAPAAHTAEMPTAGAFGATAASGVVRARGGSRRALGAGGGRRRRPRKGGRTRTAGILAAAAAVSVIAVIAYTNTDGESDDGLPPEGSSGPGALPTVGPTDLPPEGGSSRSHVPPSSGTSAVGHRTGPSESPAGPSGPSGKPSPGDASSDSSESSESSEPSGKPPGERPEHPEPAGVTCTARYSLDNEWPDGFQAKVTLTPRKTVRDWRLSWRFENGQRVTEMWNGEFVQRGSTVTVTPADYNETARGGEPLEVGFLGTWDAGNAAPTGLALNGRPCETR